MTGNTPTSLRIAVVGSRGIPATYGGVEKAIEELYARMAKRGYQVTIYGRSYYLPKGLTHYRGMHIKALYVPNIRGVEAFIHSFIATLLAIYSNADVIHFHAQGPTLFSALVRWLAPGKQVGFTCQGLDWQRDKWGRLGRWIIRAGEKASARYPHFRIGVSQYLCDYYQKTYQTPVTCIPNGVTLPTQITHQPAVVEQLGLIPEKYVLFCGRLVPEKAPDVLIKAFHHLPGDWQLAIVGDSAGTDKYTQYLKALSANDRRIVFTGYQYGAVLQQLYANAWCYASSSKLEGLPLTLLEALSYGLPVAVSDITPHMEVVELNPACGVTFETGNTQAVVQALQQLLAWSPDQRQRVRQLAREVVDTHFSWERIADRTIQAMQHL